MQVEYVNYGIGNNFGDVIELNENLKKWPRLHRSILNHELRHTDKTFTKQDLLLDLSETHVNTMELLKFMIRNPRSFSQFLPVYITKKRGVVYDLNLLLTYLVFIGIIVAVWFVALQL